MGLKSKQFTLECISQDQIKHQFKALQSKNSQFPNKSLQFWSCIERAGIKLFGWNCQSVYPKSAFLWNYKQNNFCFKWCLYHVITSLCTDRWSQNNLFFSRLTVKVSRTGKCNSSAFFQSQIRLFILLLYLSKGQKRNFLFLLLSLLKELIIILTLIWSSLPIRQHQEK